MYLCYIDESGTSETNDNTSHFVLAGLSIPSEKWKECDNIIGNIKRIYSLEKSEIHVAWLLRQYKEQGQVANFDSLDYRQRRSQVESIRKSKLLELQRANKPSQYKRFRKYCDRTKDYIHLTQVDRKNLVGQVAQAISGWGFARLFAECVDKVFFDPSRSTQSIDEQSFEQLVSRFEQYLQIIRSDRPDWALGLLIHDNNQTISLRHTQLMRKFLVTGTFWTTVQCIIETPLFVDSQLTSMVQLADVCAYALRRYLENKEEALFDAVFKRADRKDGVVVGIRHFTNKTCACKICLAHRKPTSL